MTNRVLVIVEHSGGVPDDSVWEMCSAARTLAGSGGIVAAAILGNGLERACEALARRFDNVHRFEDPSLAGGDPAPFLPLLADLIARDRPVVTLLGHTNNGMDLAPPLSVRADVPLLADCHALGIVEGRLAGVRTMYAGKVHARIVASHCDRGYMATVRPGPITILPGMGEIPEQGPDEAEGEICREAVVPGPALRRRVVRTVEARSGQVDLGQAERIVAVGRGIGEQENLGIVESLASALGAELACSRPVVDRKWLGRERQVGTSGVTVRPKLYVAIGISGSFQHLGGVRGRPLLVAINKDARAPIFGVADLGIVADLFEIVPALEGRLRALEA